MGGRGERGAWRDLWGEGEVDVGRHWRAWRRRGERERWWQGLGLGVVYGRRGKGEVDMGRRVALVVAPGRAEAAGAGVGIEPTTTARVTGLLAAGVLLS